MNTPISFEERKQLIAAAALNYVRQCRAYEHPLSPYADSIVTLREKHASYRVIADILHSAGIIVSHHSVARFCRDRLRIKSSNKGTTKKRTKSRQSPQRTSQRVDSTQNRTTSPQVPQKDALNLIAQRREETRDPMSPRRRGPRIADPRNL
jgi:hypothetical protein